MSNIPAFPTSNWQKIAPMSSGYNEGMTLRDYFAASFLSSGHVFKCMSEGDKPSLVAEQAYAMADEMIKAREFEEGWYDYEGC